MGDIILVCTNTSPELGGELVSHLVTNISVSLNVNVTNNLQKGDFTDAVLVINGNHCTAPVFEGGAGIGVGTLSCPGGLPALGAPQQSFQDPQFGELASATRIEWNALLSGRRFLRGR